MDLYQNREFCCFYGAFVEARKVPGVKFIFNVHTVSIYLRATRESLGKTNTLNVCWLSEIMTLYSTMCMCAAGVHSEPRSLLLNVVHQSRIGNNLMCC
jgi:hypothetical protein